MYINRRQYLNQSSLGFGMMALTSLLNQDAGAAKPNAAGQIAHHAAKAKHVILCFMDGGPSHVDTFDPKPELARQEGKAIGTENVSSKTWRPWNRPKSHSISWFVLIKLFKEVALPNTLPRLALRP